MVRINAEKHPKFRYLKGSEKYIHHTNRIHGYEYD